MKEIVDITQYFLYLDVTKYSWELNWTKIIKKYLASLVSYLIRKRKKNASDD